jgi:hypothetical protein
MMRLLSEDEHGDCVGVDAMRRLPSFLNSGAQASLRFVGHFTGWEDCFGVLFYSGPNLM